MIDSIVPKIRDFRNRLFPLFKFRADATIDLIDAVASSNHETIVKTSLSPLFRRKYSSITDVADNMFRREAEENPNEQELREEHLKISRLLADQCQSGPDAGRIDNSNQRTCANPQRAF